MRRELRAAGGLRMGAVWDWRGWSTALKRSETLCRRGAEVREAASEQSSGPSVVKMRPTLSSAPGADDALAGASPENGRVLRRAALRVRRATARVPAGMLLRPCAARQGTEGMFAAPVDVALLVLEKGHRARGARCKRRRAGVDEAEISRAAGLRARAACCRRVRARVREGDDGEGEIGGHENAPFSTDTPGTSPSCSALRGQGPISRPSRAGLTASIARALLVPGTRRAPVRRLIGWCLKISQDSMSKQGSCGRQPPDAETCVRLWCARPGPADRPAERSRAWPRSRRADTALQQPAATLARDCEQRRARRPPLLARAGGFFAGVTWADLQP